MNNYSTAQKLSFWQLSQANKIEVPIIQRDFAQGREDKTEVRENFLKALSSALTDQSVPLELDFVYGDVRDDVLQPLDGQQRLTTLFLLHWYITLKEGKLEESIKGALSNFTYETRASSREFCTALIEKGVDFNTLLPADIDKKGQSLKNELSKTIIDCSWFFLSWKRDPTIKAMLIMLDAIHIKFKDQNGLWEKLTNDQNPAITFHHLPLKNFGLSDDLYIKMNARGKALTDFENFKAKFEQYVLLNKWEEGLNQEETFSHKIDTIWTDLFWCYRNKDEKSKDFNLFDRELMNFFRVMAINHYTRNCKEINSEAFSDNIALLMDNTKGIPFSKYLEMGCFDKEYLVFIKSILDRLTNRAVDQKNHRVARYLADAPYFDEEELLKDVISNNLGYADLVTLYSFYHYLASEEDIDSDKLKDWMRVVRNLIEGSRPYTFNTATQFANALRSIADLFSHRNEILHYFKDTDQKSISGILEIQFEEEKLKSKLMLASGEWKEAIISAENHRYFNGQIGFLLDWSTLDKDELDLTVFREYSAKAKAVFGDDGLNKFDNFLFERALLAVGDYLLEKGQNYSFLINNDRDISWKRLLRDNNENRNCLKQLIGTINADSLLSDLQTIINDFADKEDWRYPFINQSDIIKVCEPQKLIRWNHDGKNILLLGSSTTSGYHKEYYSYSLFLKLKEPLGLSDRDYKDQRSIDYWKYFEFGEEKSKSYISFGYHLGESGQYVLCTDDEFRNEESENKVWEKGKRFDNQEALIEYLKNQNLLQD